MEIELRTHGFGALRAGLRDGIRFVCLSLCYTIMLPGRRSGFRAGFRQHPNRETLNIDPQAGLRSFPDWNPAELRPGSLISGPEALLHNMG